MCRGGLCFQHLGTSEVLTKEWKAKVCVCVCGRGWVVFGAEAIVPSLGDAVLCLV